MPKYYDPAVANALMDAYHQHPTEERRNDLVGYCLPIVAGYLSTHCPATILPDDRPDIEQYLSISLIKAIENYSDGKGAKLWTYIHCYLRYGVMDYLRLYMRQIDPEWMCQSFPTPDDVVALNPQPYTRGIIVEASNDD